MLNKIAEMNRDEIALSQLAAERASDAAVRSFAQELLQAHSKVNSELVALGEKHNYSIEGVVVAGKLPAAGSTTQVSTNAERETVANTSANPSTRMDIDASTTQSGAQGTANENRNPSASAQASNQSQNQDRSATASTSQDRNRSQDQANQDRNRANSSSAQRTTSASGSVSGSAGMQANASMQSGSSTAQTDVVAIPADELSSNHKYKSLSAKSGKDFDKDYVKEMVDAHQDAIDKFKDAAKDADDPDIRNFASMHIAALQEHLDKAKALKKTLD